MHNHVPTVAVLNALFRLALAKCCTTDDPISPFRTCSPLVATADSPFLVKAINYTRYHDDLGEGRFDPDERWDSVAVWLARRTNRQCSNDVTGCVVTGPVCKLIDCFPLSQNASRATNNGGTLISDFVVSVPGGAGPDGAYYDLATSEFDRHDGSADFTKSVWRTIPYANNASSLRYDNNFLGFNVTGTQKQDDTNADGFYPFELSDSHSWPSFSLHEVPCSAYACARRCIHQSWLESSIDIETAKACIDDCDGVDDIVNYCPDVGGVSLPISYQDLGLDSPEALDSYVPDGCAKYEGAAFPEAYSAYSASLASASSASTTITSTGQASAHATASSDSIYGRKEAAKAVAVLGSVPFIVEVVISII